LWVVLSPQNRDFQQFQTTEAAIDFNKIWYDKLIVDQHLDPDNFPDLSNYLKETDKKERDKIKKLFGRKIKKEKRTDEKQLENFFFELTNPALSHKVQETNLKNIQKLLTKMPEAQGFSRDIAGLLEEVGKRQQGAVKEFTKWVIVDTDDPDDLLLCGTEVAGSCQSVDYQNPSLNKCLVAYLADGKNRLIAIKNAKGQIVARSIMRLLWDGEKPVLFQERLYPSGADPNFEKALRAFAIARAEKLGVPLLSGEGKELYPNPVSSLGGIAPYEYVDAAQGVQQNSTFTIATPYVVHNPTI